jgi:dTDP-glucose 4,6-dehydratase
MTTTTHSHKRWTDKGGHVTPHARLITPVTDRPGHDRRYAIDPTRISHELGWQPRHSFEEGLAATVRWYLKQHSWCRAVRHRAGYGGDRLGVLTGDGAN